MPKALVLTDEMLAAPAPQPRAAQATPPAQPAKEPKPPKVELAPLQIKIPADQIKAIKIDALQAGQTVSDFLLACYHARKKS